MRSRDGAAYGPSISRAPTRPRRSTFLSAIALALIGEGQARRIKLTPSHLFSTMDETKFDQLDPKPAYAAVDFYASQEQAIFHLDPTFERITGQRDPLSVVLGYGP